MEEFALVIGSVAGACSAVAIDKIPRRKQIKNTITFPSAINNQLHSLKAEREIITKTISRLHQPDLNLTKIQRDKLLIRYQHQMEIVGAKIEKLEATAWHSDFGAIGDTLINLMDTKLSKLDQRLNEISSKISESVIQSRGQPTTPVQSTHNVKQQDESKQRILEIPRIEKREVKTEVQELEPQLKDEKFQTIIPQISDQVTERHRSVELSTLTEIPSKMPEFPVEFIKYSNRQEMKNTLIESTKEPLGSVKLEPAPTLSKESSISELHNSAAEHVEKKIQLPTPIKIPDEEKIEDDDKDLDRIKNEIMKALSKLEQVEVE